MLTLGADTDFRRGMLTSRKCPAVFGQSAIEHRTRHSDRHLQSVQRSPVFFFANANSLLVIALPLSMVARVRVSKKQKVGLFVVLSLGVFIIGVAIARIIVTDTQGVHPEISWLALWSTVESSVAVIVCCLASFKALFRIQRVSSRSQPYYAQGCGTVGSQGRGVVLTTIEARDDVRDRGEFDTSSQVEILKDAAGMGLNRHDRLCKRNGSTGEARVEPRI